MTFDGKLFVIIFPLFFVFVFYISTGLSKTYVYSMKKVNKMLKGRRQQKEKENS